MELPDYIRLLRKNWSIIVAAMLLGVIGGGTMAATATPKYTASTRLFVSVRAGEGAASIDLNQGTTFARQAVTTYADVVGSAIVLEPVITELGLTQSVADLAGQVTASSPAGTVLIDIAVTDPSPKHAATVANAVGASFASVVTEELEKPSGGASLVNIRTIQPASAPSRPSSPNIPVLLGVGMLAGLALGVGIAVARTLLDTRMRTIQDLESITRKPFLGGIAFDPDAKKLPVVMHAEPHSLRAEGYRRLRTSFQFVNVTAGQRTFVITSAGPGEGKSNVATNLSIALADAGAKVALVDGDLRRPRVADYLGIEGGAGLTDLLIGRAELHDVLQPWGGSPLFVLAAGRIPPNPSELLGSQAMRATLDHLSEDFDYVIIDAPPLLPVADAAVLSSIVAGVLLITGIGQATKSNVVSSLRILDGVKANLLGVVATMLPVTGPDASAYGEYLYYGGDADASDQSQSYTRPRRARARRGRKPA
ncbi:polysaccharide biosynthesis tyrosine autokinase [Leifsonia sp. Le1]|uniref:polysaccharide biosynthesis tyrosine autokinase n=1 Tax=Leifsonia sp. Le1 TaxID=3404918 RepID=UPI003EC065CC